MQLTHRFIDKPILATVVSIFITLIGLGALVSLPVAQYPEIVPPTVQVTTSYPGASAEVVSKTVATPLEQEINGVENMLYMSSQSTGDGKLTITVTFRIGTNLNTAQVLTQNRVQDAVSRLPDIVQRLGVRVAKTTPNILLVAHLFSPDGSLDQIYMSNYATLHVRDALARLPGMGDVQVFGSQDYAMRIWLDPDRVAAYRLNPGEVIAALQAQNVQVSAGVLNQPPTPSHEAFQLNVQTLGRLSTPEQFGQVILKTDAQGRVTRLRDVGRVEVGAQDYGAAGYLDRSPAIPILVFAQPGANSLAVESSVRATMAELSKSFPAGLAYRIVYDPTEFISKSVHEVIVTIAIAIALVVAVVILFLQTWRASLIPVVAIPVSLIGTFAVLGALGISLNNLSLFGLVLAVGIVVDDAIVVVENVERNIAAGYAPREAAHRTMDEVGGALVAIALTLCAVFVPAAFLSGISGAFFKQFAVTISASTLISLVVSLTLSPALCAVLLRPHDADGMRSDDVEAMRSRDLAGVRSHDLAGVRSHDLAGVRSHDENSARSHDANSVRSHDANSLQSHGSPTRGRRNLLARAINAFFGVFNRGFEWMSDAYGRLTMRLVRALGLMLVAYAALIAASAWQFSRAPTGFVPEQDQSYLITVLQLPAGATLDRTKKVLDQVNGIILATPGVSHIVPFAGLEATTFTDASNAATVFSTLTPFEARAAQGLSAPRILADLRRRLSVVQGAVVLSIMPPPVQGIGSAGGFKMMVQDRSGVGSQALEAAAQKLVAAANKDPAIGGAFTLFSTHTPSVYADIDRERAEKLELDPATVFSALQLYMGSTYINDFNYLGRTFEVVAQADGPYRRTIDDIARLRVRNAAGSMVPLGSVAAFHDVTAPYRVPRYDLFPAAEVMGGAAPGVSTGTALQHMQALADRVLPKGVGYEWTELAFQQEQRGTPTILVFGAAALFVFLVLAAQYESWKLPLSVVLIVPMCLLASVTGLLLRGMPVDILAQIGFVVLVGLAAKNAILIVEFAKQAQDAGNSPRSAAVHAARTRLRPILMTSFAFILGVAPLVFATGAGAEMRQSLGTAVFGGMLGVTGFGLLFTPAFYAIMQGAALRRSKVRVVRAQVTRVAAE